MSQYRDSRLTIQTLTVAVPGDPDFPVTFQRLKLLDSCGRNAVCNDGAENDNYSQTQEQFYSHPIFLHQPRLNPGLYFLLLAPMECPCLVSIHGLVVGTQPSGDPWPVAGLEGHSTRCRQGAVIRFYGPAVVGGGLPGADGKPGVPATISISRAVAGGPTTNEEQLVTFGPDNFFGGGHAEIGNRLFQVQVGDSPSFVPPGNLITPSDNGGVRITREAAGFRIGYSGAHGNQAITLPTVTTGVNASTLRSTTASGIAASTGASDDFSEGYLYVESGDFDGGQLYIPLGVSAGCTGNLGGTLTNPDGSTALTVVAA